MNKYNLIDILSKELIIEEQDASRVYKFEGIQIPMIQRDYAQGRAGEGEIRNRFLKSIFNALVKNENLELDFVYGSIKELDKKIHFIPLDGQQRLTTLFLLHWYIGKRELKDNELDLLLTKLKGFSYATRSSARDFCEKLIEISISFKNEPSKEITNSAWFYARYEKDPTVKAMLIMLDAIHSYYEKELANSTFISLFSSLSKLSFYILPLGGFNLSDELYIKMNARGKQLTDFENFKADLTNWLKDDLNTFKTEFQKRIDFKGRQTPYYLSFAAKIDNDWTNLFWSFTKFNSEPKDRLVDSYFLQFMNRYLLNAYISHSSLKQDAIEKEPLLHKLYGKEGNNDLFKYQDFDFYEIIFNQEGFIKRTELIFDQLYKNIKLVEDIIKPSWDKEPAWTLFSKEINQRQRVLFYSVTVYLEMNDFDETKFKNWIRVVWNIIVDPNIRSIPAMVGAIRLIKQLSEGSADIYNYLNNNIDSVLLDGDRRIKDEKIKAVFINADSQWEEEIIEAESHPMFKGSIRFLFPDLEKTTFETFTEFKNAAFQIFSKKDGSHGVPENNLWLRAVLAKNSNINLPITLADGRFDNWNFLINNQLLSGINEVLKISITSNDEINKTLKSIIEDNTLIDKPLWLYNLINWEDKDGKCLLDYSETQIVRKYQGYNEDIQEVYLFNQTIWTEGNILISNLRNEIISELLNLSPDIKHSGVASNIQNQFFRGWNINLGKHAHGFPFSYLFDRKSIRIGIKSIPELVESFKEFDFEDDEKENGWICRKKYNYLDIRQVEIKSFLEKIENEVFEESDPDSLIYKLLNQKV